MCREQKGSGYAYILLLLSEQIIENRLDGLGDLLLLEDSSSILL
jgi:hypothetical protein